MILLLVVYDFTKEKNIIDNKFSILVNIGQAVSQVLECL